MSIKAAWGLIPRMTPFIVPTNQSFKPKSVVRVIIGLGLGLRLLECGSARPLSALRPFMSKRQSHWRTAKPEEALCPFVSSASGPQFEVSKLFQELRSVCVAITLGQISPIGAGQNGS